MPAALVISRVTLRPLAIPLRQKFAHAGAAREVAEPLVVSIELADHTVGHGETHPRPYVSGETIDTAIADIRRILIPLLVNMRPANFGEALESIAALPFTDDVGRPITAARAAVELALLDAYSRAFNRSLEAIGGFLEELAFIPPGSSQAATYSGILSGGSADQNPGRKSRDDLARKLRRSIRRMCWFGLRDFKLKVGDADDDARLRNAAEALAGRIARGKARLRIDANFAWTLDQARRQLNAWRDLPISSVEQPLPRGHLDDWKQLAIDSPFPIMADESLVTPADAEALTAASPRIGFNIRISKNGGLIPAMRLAAHARRYETPYQLGCMVGETSILSAAGRWFLNLVPGVRFAEGSYGRFLLTDDIATPRQNLRYRGRIRPISGPGIGVRVDEHKLNQYAASSPTELPL